MKNVRQSTLYTLIDQFDRSRKITALEADQFDLVFSKLINKIDMEQKIALCKIMERRQAYLPRTLQYLALDTRLFCEAWINKTKRALPEPIVELLLYHSDYDANMYIIRHFPVTASQLLPVLKRFRKEEMLWALICKENLILDNNFLYGLGEILVKNPLAICLALKNQQNGAAVFCRYFLLLPTKKQVMFLNSRLWSAMANIIPKSGIYQVEKPAEDQWHAFILSVKNGFYKKASEQFVAMMGLKISNPHCLCLQENRILFYSYIKALNISVSEQILCLTLLGDPGVKYWLHELKQFGSCEIDAFASIFTAAQTENVSFTLLETAPIQENDGSLEGGYTNIERQSVYPSQRTQDTHIFDLPSSLAG